MATYLAGQEADILIALERYDEAIAPLDYAQSYRAEMLAQAPDDYYRLTQLMTVQQRYTQVHRHLGNADKAVSYAEEAVTLARKMHEADPVDVSGREGLAKMLGHLAEALAESGQRSAAISAVDESLALHRGLQDSYDNSPVAISDLVTGLITAARTHLAIGAEARACGYIEEASGLLTQLPEPDGDRLAELEGLNSLAACD